MQLGTSRDEVPSSRLQITSIDRKQSLLSLKRIQLRHSIRIVNDEIRTSLCFVRVGTPPARMQARDEGCCLLLRPALYCWQRN